MTCKQCDEDRKIVAHGICKRCYNREWRKTHKTYNADYKKQWVRENADKRKAAEARYRASEKAKQTRKEWEKANKEKRAEYQRNWARKHSGRRNEQLRQYREANKDRLNAIRRAQYAANRPVRTYRKRTKAELAVEETQRYLVQGETFTDRVVEYKRIYAIAQKARESLSYFEEAKAVVKEVVDGLGTEAWTDDADGKPVELSTEATELIDQRLKERGLA